MNKPRYPLAVALLPLLLSPSPVPAADAPPGAEPVLVPGRPVVLQKVLIEEALAGNVRRNQMIDGKAESVWATFGDNSPLCYDNLTAPHEKFCFDLTRRAFEFTLNLGRERTVSHLLVMSNDDSFRRAKAQILPGLKGVFDTASPAAVQDRPGAAISLPYRGSVSEAPQGKAGKKGRGGGKGKRKGKGGGDGGGEDPSDDDSVETDPGGEGAPTRTTAGKMPASLVAFAKPVRADALRLRVERQDDPKLVWLNEVEAWNVSPGAFRGRGEALPATAKADGTRLQIPAFAEERGIEAITLKLPAKAAFEGVLPLELLDPFTQGRTFALADGRDDYCRYFLLRAACRAAFPAKAAAGEALELTLDVPDFVLEKGKPLDLNVGSDAFDLAKAEVTVHATSPSDPETVREHVATALLLAREAYSVHAEARNWLRSRDRPGMMRLWLEDVLRRDPENAVAHGYLDRLDHKNLAATLKVEAPEGAPDWAAWQNALVYWNQRVADYWVARQDPEGQIGQSIKDDVVLTCQLGIFDALNDDGTHPVGRMIERLADCSWNSGRLENGFPTPYKNDLLHASDEIAESQPPAMLFRYGSPKIHERLQITFRNWFSSTTKEEGGARVFTKYTGGGWTQNKRMRCSVPGMYLNWYARNDTAEKWIRQYYDGWLGGGAGRLTDMSNNEMSFDDEFCLALWHWTGEGKYLQAVGRKIHLGPQRARIEKLYGKGEAVLGAGKPGPTPPPGAGMQEKREAGAILLTIPANADFSVRSTVMADDNHSDAWIRTGDKAALAADYRQMTVAAYLLDQHQTEAHISTDRIYPVARRLIPCTTLGGPSSVRASYPAQAVSYEGLKPGFASLVVGDNPQWLKVLLYNLKDQPKEGILRVWELENGTYEFKQGPDKDGDDKMDEEAVKKTVALYRGEGVPISLPPRVQQVIEIRQLQKGDDIRLRPDAGIDAQDVSAAASEVAVKVHSIGAKDLPAVAVRVLDKDGKTVGEASTPPIPAPNDMVPKSADVKIPVAGIPAKVVLDPEDKLAEITNRNNEVLILEGGRTWRP